MLIRRAQIYVGPVDVKELCERAKAAGYTDVWAGTEHMYVNLDDKQDGWGIMDSLFELETKIKCKLGKVIALKVVAE